MRKLISILLLLVLGMTGVAEQAPAMGIIGSADSPVEIIISDRTVSADELIPLLLEDCAAQLNQLSGDEGLLRMMTSTEEMAQIAGSFHANSMNGVISWKRITDVELFFTVFSAGYGSLSEAAQAYMNQRFYTASTLGSMLCARQGSQILAATALLNTCKPLNADLPSALYAAKCDNDTGFIMGIWNNGNGMVLVTSSFVPDISCFDSSSSITALLR